MCREANKWEEAEKVTSSLTMKCFQFPNEGYPAGYIKGQWRLLAGMWHH